MNATDEHAGLVERVAGLRRRLDEHDRAERASVQERNRLARRARRARAAFGAGRARAGGTEGGGESAREGRGAGQPTVAVRARGPGLALLQAQQAEQRFVVEHSAERHAVLEAEAVANRWHIDDLIRQLLAAVRERGQIDQRRQAQLVAEGRGHERTLPSRLETGGLAMGLERLLANGGEQAALVRPKMTVQFSRDEEHEQAVVS